MRQKATNIVLLLTLFVISGKIPFSEKDKARTPFFMIIILVHSIFNGVAQDFSHNIDEEDERNRMGKEKDFCPTPKNLIKTVQLSFFYCK